MSFQAMAWASEQTTGSCTRKAVLYALANHANREGECYLKVSTICSEAEVGDRAARTALTVLEMDGLLKKHRKRRADGTLGVLHFTLPLPARNADGLPALDADGPAAADAAQEPGSSLEPIDQDLPPSTSPQVFVGKLNVRYHSQIVATWISHAPPLMRHRDTYMAAGKTRSAVERALNTYPVEDIAEAIRSYATVLGGSEYRWDYSWPLVEFLNRGLDKFVPEARPLENFRIKATGNGPNMKYGRRDVSSAEILALGERLKAERIEDERKQLASG